VPGAPRQGADALPDGDTPLSLEQSDLCRNLTERQIERLRGIAQPMHLTAGSVVQRQGREADAVYLPCSGCLMVERTAAGGQRQVLAFLHRGYFLGLNNGNVCFYSAIALEDSHLLRFPAERFYALEDEIPVLRDNVGRISNQVLARVLDHLFAIGQKRAHARLAFLLWQLWYRASTDGSEMLLHLPMRRADIGDYLGLTLETTSRAFSRLRQEGIIETPDNHSVRITNRKTLQELADVK
jgi:CRP-like cAMP-binding protein